MRLMNVARAISEALLKDFGTNSTFSNWFDREEKQPTRITKVVKKPNPKNIEAQENIQALEARVKQYGFFHPEVKRFANNR